MADYGAEPGKRLLMHFYEGDGEEHLGVDIRAVPSTKALLSLYFTPEMLKDLTTHLQAQKIRLRTKPLLMVNGKCIGFINNYVYDRHIGWMWIEAQCNSKEDHKALEKPHAFVGLSSESLKLRTL